MKMWGLRRIESIMSSNAILFQSARFMNTYKLDSDKPFNPEKVQKVLEEILLEALEGPYDEVKCPLKAKQASAAIRAKIKEMEFDRYLSQIEVVEYYFFPACAITRYTVIIK